MSSNDGIVPIVAGVVLGAGLLFAIYTLFLSGPRCGKEVDFYGPCACSCEPNAKIKCKIHDHRRKHSSK